MDPTRSSDPADAAVPLLDKQLQPGGQPAYSCG